MKLTREMLHELIDSYPQQYGGETIFVNMTYSILTKCPTILPYYWSVVGRTTSDIFDKHMQTFHLANERASYLETYLAGKMYPEDVAKRPEYIEIQRGHAETIEKETAKALGIKKEV